MVTRRHLEFWWDFSILRPESPIGKASPLRYFCLNELLHFICKQSSILSSFGFFEKGFGALSRSQVFGKADSFRLF